MPFFVRMTIDWPPPRCRIWRKGVQVLSDIAVVQMILMLSFRFLVNRKFKLAASLAASRMREFARSRRAMLPYLWPIPFPKLSLRYGEI